MPNKGQFPGEISDLWGIDGSMADNPRRLKSVDDNNGISESSLPLLSRLQLKLFGYAYVRHRRQPGWRGLLPFYAFKFGVHGLVEDYPHGYNKRLDCPSCMREDELTRVFDEKSMNGKSLGILR